MLVLDANIAIAACARPNGFEYLGGELIGPPLMWSEARTILHLNSSKRAIDRGRALRLHARLEAAPVARIDPPELGREAWRLADEFGWGRTYDAEFVALARMFDCRLVTLDNRLRRGTDRLGFVITPAEL
jgi:predicted nucleic acid-binding protein